MSILFLRLVWVSCDRFPDRIHWCSHPKPGPLGCGPPICTKSSTLSQCKRYYSCDSGGGGCSYSGFAAGSEKDDEDFQYDTTDISHQNDEDFQYDTTGTSDQDDEDFKYDTAGSEFYYYRQCSNDDECTFTTCKETSDTDGSCDYVRVCGENSDGSEACRIIHRDDICEDDASSDACVGFFNYYFANESNSHNHLNRAKRMLLYYFLPSFCFLTLLLAIIIKSPVSTSEKSLRCPSRPSSKAISIRYLTFDDILLFKDTRKRYRRDQNSSFEGHIGHANPTFFETCSIGSPSAIWQVERCSGRERRCGILSNNRGRPKYYRESYNSCRLMNLFLLLST